MNVNNLIDLGPATLENYMETRSMLLKKADELTIRMSRMEPVRTLEEMNELLAVEQDRKLIVEMIASCSYIIEWLQTGRRPGNARGIERRAGYQREVPMDPATLPAVPQLNTVPMEPENVNHFRLEAAMRGLTDRERECYMLSQGQNYSFSDIAEVLQISKSSVGTYMIRARRKVAANVTQIHIRIG